MHVRRAAAATECIIRRRVACPSRCLCLYFSAPRLAQPTQRWQSTAPVRASYEADSLNLTLTGCPPRPRPRLWQPSSPQPLQGITLGEPASYSQADCLLRVQCKSRHHKTRQAAGRRDLSAGTSFNDPQLLRSSEVRPVSDPSPDTSSNDPQ